MQRKTLWNLFAVLTVAMLLALGLSRSAPVVQAQTGTVELVGQIGGSTNAVFVDGNTAYIGVGPRLVILDISNPANPTQIGQSPVLPDLVKDIYVSGSYAYVAGGEIAKTTFGYLKVVDISNPANPTLAGSYTTPDSAEGVEVSGNFAYVAAATGGLQIINISNPTNPSLSGSTDTPGIAHGVAVSGSYAYVADYGSGLQIINISNPANPSLTASYDTPGSAYGVAVSGSYAYMADSSNGLQIINISNPASPTLTGSYDTPSEAWGVAVSGDFAYVADYRSGLQIINISNPANPSLSGSYDTTGYALEVAVSGDFAYVADSGLQIINISNPANPTLTASYATPNTALGVAVSGSYAYVADQNRGLQIINISNPANPSLSGSYDTPDYDDHAIDVTVNSNFAYVGSGPNGLQVINISDPTNPTLTSSYTTPGTTYKVAINGNYAYVSDGPSGLLVLDISNPTNPTLTGSYNTPSEALDVTVSGNYAYVTDYQSGLQIIDISNPANPTLLGSYDTPDSAYGIAVSGNFAYVADYQSGLQIINISDPANPTLSGSYDTSGSAVEVIINDGYAYVADYTSGLQIINISNPANPTLTASYDTPGFATGVAVSGDFAYVADDYGGLVVLQFNEAPPTPTHTPTPTSTNTPQPTAEPTHTATATPTNTPMPTHTPQPPTPTNTTTPQPNQPDAFEIDDTCPQAQPIAADGSIQVHTFHDQADEDWVYFEATQGMTYTIEARVPPTSKADVVLRMQDSCNSAAQGQNPPFSSDIRYTLTSPLEGRIYLRLLDENPGNFGNQVEYQLSVRTVEPPAAHGALLIVAGQYKENDDLQANIHHVTKRVYQLFRSKGHPKDNIRYLAPDLTLDADNDGQSDVHDYASLDTMRQAITEWAKDKVGPDRALTIFLMDHGAYDKFYLDRPRGQLLTPNNLDGWLSQLEAETDVKVNLIIEACQSGSFIDAGQSVSRNGRVIITAADAFAPSYATRQGAVFSDMFLSSLQSGRTLDIAFEEGRLTAKRLPRSVTLTGDQIPWIDADGNNIPNQATDLAIAAQRGFAISGSFAEEEIWPPYIEQAEIREWDEANQTGTIWATVLDDQPLPDTAWAVLYAPSDEAPDDPTEIVPEPRRISLLEDIAVQYGAEFSSSWHFSEQGEYRLLLYAEDDSGLLSRPYELTLCNGICGGTAVYLPLLVK